MQRSFQDQRDRPDPDRSLSLKEAGPMSRNPHIGIVVGSTREGRFSERAAAWFHKIAALRTDLSVEIIDLRDYPMPFFDEPASPAWTPPMDPVAVRWAAKLVEFDGFVFVTPEYNHGYSAVLKKIGRAHV